MNGLNLAFETKTVPLRKKASIKSPKDNSKTVTLNKPPKVVELSNVMKTLSKKSIQNNNLSDDSTNLDNDSSENKEPIKPGLRKRPGFIKIVNKDDKILTEISSINDEIKSSPKIKSEKIIKNTDQNNLEDLDKETLAIKELNDENNYVLETLVEIDPEIEDLGNEIDPEIEDLGNEMYNKIISSRTDNFKTESLEFSVQSMEKIGSKVEDLGNNFSEQQARYQEKFKYIQVVEKSTEEKINKIENSIVEEIKSNKDRSLNINKGIDKIENSLVEIKTSIELLEKFTKEHGTDIEELKSSISEHNNEILKISTITSNSLKKLETMNDGYEIMISKSNELSLKLDSMMKIIDDNLSANNIHIKEPDPDPEELDDPGSDPGSDPDPEELDDPGSDPEDEEYHQSNDYEYDSEMSDIESFTQNKSMSSKDGPLSNGHRDLKKIATGAYSSVYRLVDDSTDKTFALKRNIISKGIDYTASVRELDILHQLGGHPYIIKLISLEGERMSRILSPIKEKDKTNDQTHFLFEKADNDLYTIINNNKHYKNLTIEIVDSYILQILLAVEYMNGKGFIHRDIKPANILIQGDSIKLCDMGMSKPFRKNCINSPDVVTEMYRPPEISKNQNYKLNVDVWSIGSIFYELMTRIPLQYDYENPKENVAYTILQSTVFPFDIQSIESISNAVDFQKFSEKNTSMIPRNELVKYSLPTPSLTSDKDSTNTEINYKICFPYVFKKRIIKNISEYNNVSLPRYGFFLLTSPLFNCIKNKIRREQLISLMKRMINTDPGKRASVSECINDPYFSNKESYIRQIREQFPPKSPITKRLVLDSPNNPIVYKWIIPIVNSILDNHDQIDWYKQDILVHTLEIFGRYISWSDDNGSEHNRVKTELKFYSCLYLQIKYFFHTNYSLHFGDILPEGNDYNIKNVDKFEDFILKHVLKYTIFIKTDYEEMCNKLVGEMPHKQFKDYISSLFKNN